jgi:sulfite reductase (ferredoxin)
VDPAETFDVSPYVFALTSRFLSEPDSWLMPRKLKIAFSNTETDTVLASFHDLGFIATIKDDGLGFRVYVAGGLGAKPAVGRLLHEFIPAEDVYIIAEAVKRLYNRHGNRRNKHRNRLRFLWEDMGESSFLEQYRFFEAEVRGTNPAPLEWNPGPVGNCGPLPAPCHLESEDFELWKHRYVFSHIRPDLRQVLIPVTHGNLPVTQALQLADFLEPFGPDAVRGTREQNLLLRHIPASHLGNVYELVKDWNSLVRSPRFLGQAVVCTGASTCKLGICLPRPAMEAIARHLSGAKIPLDDLENFRLNFSGCPNSCGNHWTADLGFYGRAAHKGSRFYPAYNVVAGGRVKCGDVALATNVGEIGAKHLPAFIQEFLESYLKKKSRFKTFQEYLEREGMEDLNTICRKHGEAPDYATNPDFYTDWGATETFSLANRGQGECSAGLFDLIEFDLKKARERWSALDKDNFVDYRTNVLYQAVLFSARALLVTRGVEPHGESQAFDLFLKHFVDAGLVESRFRPLLEAARSRDLHELSNLEPVARDLMAAVEALYLHMDDSFHFAPRSPAAEPAVQGEPVSADLPEVAIKDLRGVACPMNFVKTKIVLDGMAAGQRLAILLDDGAPIINVPRSVQGEGHKVLEQTRKGDHWLVLIEKC